MQAIGIHEPGGPDVLQLVELPDPEPAAGEILVRVRAAAVNPTDTGRRAGYQNVREQTPPLVVGMDAAGVVERIGPGTSTDLQVGDDVMAIVSPHDSHGAYAELVALPAESVAAAPAGTSHAQAATLPMNGLTARLALDLLALTPGDLVAVTGAAGAMGGYAVQLAKADGLIVVADAAPADEDLITSLGADTVLPRGDGFAEHVRERYPDGVAGLIDGALLLEKVSGAVRDAGTIITLRGHKAKGERGIDFRPVFVSEYLLENGKLDALRRQAEDGIVTLRVADVLPKERAAEAHRRLESGGVRGRLVLEF